MIRTKIAVVAAMGLVVVSGCTLNNQQQAGQSPESSPSTSPATSTPSTAPPPAESPTPVTSPSAATSPSPAKLIISSLPFHAGEVGVAYTPVALKAKGGVPPYKWSIQGGALPTGVVLSTGGSATGKPTTTGTFAFSVRVDDSAGGAAGAPSSILVFRQLKFSVTSITCGNSPSSCTLSIPYTGGIPGGRPVVKVSKVTGATIDKTVNGCASSTVTATNSPPPGTKLSASGGTMTLSAGPSDRTTWCAYQGTIDFVLVAQSPCGAGLLCTSSNSVAVRFSI